VTSMTTSAESLWSRVEWRLPPEDVKRVLATSIRGVRSTPSVAPGSDSSDQWTNCFVDPTAAQFKRNIKVRTPAHMKDHLTAQSLSGQDATQGR